MSGDWSEEHVFFFVRTLPVDIVLLDLGGKEKKKKATVKEKKKIKFIKFAELSNHLDSTATLRMLLQSELPRQKSV